MMVGQAEGVVGAAGVWGNVGYSVGAKTGTVLPYVVQVAAFPKKTGPPVPTTLLLLSTKRGEYVWNMGGSI